MSMCMLMNLATTGPDLDEFNPNSSISHWINSDAGVQHINGPLQRLCR